MADIIYNYPSMRAAASQIRELANRYKSAADVFEGDFTTAVSDWEGAAKEAVLKYITQVLLTDISQIPCQRS